MVVAIFRGTEKEAVALMAAVENNCQPPDQCIKDATGRLTRICGGHKALLDQRYLDGLLFMRRDVERLRAEEWAEN